MPGFEVTRFVNITQTEEDELSCGICFGILIEPLVTQCCRQTYCKQCISEWLNNNNTCPNDRQTLEYQNLTIPPRLVINMLNKLQIKCNYIENGCKAILILEMLEQHIKVCRYNPNGICIDCGFINGVVEQHNCLKNFKNCIISEVRKNEESSQKIRSLECELMKVNANSKLLENKVQSMSLEINSLSQSKNELILRVSQNERLINQYKEKEISLNRKLETNILAFNETEKQINYKNIKILGLEKSLKELNSKLLEMKQNLQIYETNISIKEKHNNEYKERNSYLIETIEKNKITYEKVLETKIDNITERESQIKHIKQLFNKSENALQIKSTLIEQKCNELVLLEKKLQNSSKNNKHLLSKNLNLKIENKMFRQNIDQLNEDKDEINVKFDIFKTDLDKSNQIRDSCIQSQLKANNELIRIYKVIINDMCKHLRVNKSTGFLKTSDKKFVETIEKNFLNEKINSLLSNYQSNDNGINFVDSWQLKKDIDDIKLKFETFMNNLVEYINSKNRIYQRNVDKKNCLKLKIYNLEEKNTELNKDIFDLNEELRSNKVKNTDLYNVINDRNKDLRSYEERFNFNIQQYRNLNCNYYDLKKKLEFLGYLSSFLGIFIIIGLIAFIYAYSKSYLRIFI